MSFVLCKMFEILIERNGELRFDELFSQLKEHGWKNRSNLEIYWQACVYFSILRGKDHLSQESLDKYINEEYIKRTGLAKERDVLIFENGKVCTRAVFWIWPERSKIILYKRGDEEGRFKHIETDIITNEWELI